MKQNVIAYEIAEIEHRNGNVIIPEWVTYSIVEKKGELHWDADVPLKKCWDCDYKLSFPNREVAELYATFMKTKYDKTLRVYFSDNRCCSYHLTSKW